MLKMDLLVHFKGTSFVNWNEGHIGPFWATMSVWVTLSSRKHSPRIPISGVNDSVSPHTSVMKKDTP